MVNKTHHWSLTRPKHISYSSCIPKLSINFRFIRSNQQLLRGLSSPVPHQCLPGHLHRLSVLVLGCTEPRAPLWPGKGLKYRDTAQRVAGSREDRPQAMVFIQFTWNFLGLSSFQLQTTSTVYYERLWCTLYTLLCIRQAFVALSLGWRRGERVISSAVLLISQI